MKKPILLSFSVLYLGSTSKAGSVPITWEAQAKYAKLGKLAALLSGIRVPHKGPSCLRGHPFWF